MFNELKLLIFGLEEYEKVKIESRIQDAMQLSSKLKVHNKVEFEVLEDVISKIKEQLRIKSSNLNKIIKDSSRSLSRKEVDNLLAELNRIKYEFLDIAEKHIVKETPKIAKEEPKIIDIPKAKPQEEKIEIEHEEPEEEIDSEPIPEPTPKQEEYREINTSEHTKPTKKYEEDSLDALLQEVQEKRKEVHTQKPIKETTATIETNTEEPIIEHEKKEVTINNEAIEVEHATDNKFIIYQDQKITAHLKTNSQVPGEILVEANSNMKLNELKEEDLSYIVSFSKIFASVAFEVLEAHGTNIYWNYKDNQVHILPRYQDDGINLLWTPKTLSEKQFEEIKDKLIADMLNEIPKAEKLEVKKEPEKEISKVAAPLQKKEILDPEVISQTGESLGKSEDLNSKAQEIIDALNKIP